MDASSLRALIEQVASGACPPDEAVRQLRRLPYADLGFARVDHHRDLRLGMPETVYGPGKSPEHCAAIVAELLEAIGEDPDREGLRSTPRRVASMYAELLAGIEQIHARYPNPTA